MWGPEHLGKEVVEEMRTTGRRMWLAVWSQWAAGEASWRRGGGRQTTEGTGLGLGLLRRREQVGPQVKRAGDWLLL